MSLKQELAKKDPAEKSTGISFKQILFLLKPPSSFRPGILFLAEARDLVFFQKFQDQPPIQWIPGFISRS
jgi:hypothetical protein